MSTSELQAELTELRTLLGAQQDEIDTLKRASASTAPGASTRVAPPDAPAETSRRNLLKKTIVGGAVGAAGLAAARPAAAADDGNFVLGQTNEATSTTALNRTGASDAIALQVSANGNARAIESTSATGIGVLGLAESGDALFGQATTGRAVVASGNGSALGLQASSASGIGAIISSETGTPLVLRPSTTAFGPPTSGFHEAGSFFVDQFGDLYYNDTAGTPGNWRPLRFPSGPSFTPAPVRAYDSRPTEPGSPAAGPKSKFTSGVTRVIDLTVDGPILATDRGALLNVTVTDTVDGGFASVYSGDSPDLNPPTFASINWFETGQTVGNHVPTVVSSTGTIKIFTVRPTHIVVDVIGYLL